MSTGSGKRGRPPKFGRPGRLLAFTVPDDVREWLETVHHDPGWALVSLFEAATASSKSARPPREIPSAEIALLVGRRGLIVVNRGVMPPIPGVSLIPLSDTQAFLALEPGKGLADIELLVIDALEDATSAESRRALAGLRDMLRQWRKDPHWRFESRAIVVAERTDPGAKSRKARAASR